MIEQNPRAITVVRVWVRQNIIITVMAVFIVLSILLHVVTLLALQRVRDIVRLQLSSSADQVAAARRTPVRYDFPVRQSFPFSTVIDVNETFDVPIREEFPINETFNVPIDVGPVLPGAGVFNIPIPLNLTVPVSTTVKVEVIRQIPISTTIDIDTSVPLELDLDQPPLGNLLNEIEATLRELLTQL